MGLSGLLVGCLLVMLIGLLIPPVASGAVTGDLAVTRDLPDTMQPGEEFDVTVTFTSPGGVFSNIGFGDVVPEVTWIVTDPPDLTKISPHPTLIGITDNKPAIVWMKAGGYGAGTQFTACDQVTVPADATPRVYDFPNGVVRYTLGPKGEEVEYEVDITGDSQVEILPEYDLTISSAEGGSVTILGEGTFAYHAGEVVELVASPEAGYEFDEWTGDVDTVANVDDATTTITMDGNYSITAHFSEISAAQYDLTISSVEGGSVTTPGEGTFAYDAGEVVELEATSDDGYQFDEWTGDVADVNDATTTITMDGDKSITAVFSAVTPGASPASFSASGLQISPQQVQPDQQVEISIDIANDGGATGSHTVILYINGKLEDSYTARSIAPGSLENVAFTVSRSTSGTYDVSLEGLQGQFTVAAPPATTSPGGLGTGTLIVIVAIIVALIVAIVFVIARVRRA